MRIETSTSNGNYSSAYSSGTTVDGITFKVASGIIYEAGTNDQGFVYRYRPYILYSYSGKASANTTFSVRFSRGSDAITLPIKVTYGSTYSKTDLPTLYGSWQTNQPYSADGSATVSSSAYVSSTTGNTGSTSNTLSLQFAYLKKT